MHTDHFRLKICEKGTNAEQTKNERNRHVEKPETSDLRRQHGPATAIRVGIADKAIDLSPHTPTHPTTIPDIA